MPLRHLTKSELGGRSVKEFPGVVLLFNPQCGPCMKFKAIGGPWENAIKSFTYVNFTAIELPNFDPTSIKDVPREARGVPCVLYVYENGTVEQINRQSLAEFLKTTIHGYGFKLIYSPYCNSCEMFLPTWKDVVSRLPVPCTSFQIDTFDPTVVKGVPKNLMDEGVPLVLYVNRENEMFRLSTNQFNEFSKCQTQSDINNLILMEVNP